MLIVIVLSVVMISVIVLSVVMLSVIVLSVVMLSAIILNVAAPIYDVGGRRFLNEVVKRALANLIKYFTVVTYDCNKKDTKEDCKLHGCLRRSKLSSYN